MELINGPPKWNGVKAQLLLLSVIVLGFSCGLIYINPLEQIQNQISKVDLSQYEELLWESFPLGVIDGNYSELSPDARKTKEIFKWALLLTSSVLVPVVLFLLLCAVSYIDMNLTKRSRMLNKFSGVPKFPLIGSLWAFIGTPEDIAITISKAVSRHGRLITFWMGNRPYLGIVEAEAAQKVLSSTRYIDKGRDYLKFKWLLGDGLITSNGDVWREDRKLLSPSFKYQRFDGFLASFNKHSKILVDILSQKFPKGTEVHNFHPIVCKTTIDFVTDGALGKSEDAQRNPDTKFVEMTHIALESFRTQIVKPWLALPIIWNIFGLGRQEPKVLEYFYETLGQTIEERRRFRLNKTKEERELETNQTNPFMDALLESRSDAEIVAHVITIFGAGFETTASGMNYTLYLLGLNPEHQAKVHEEIDSLFEDDKDRDVTFTDLTELKYLEMCIKEALRLFPPAPVFIRVPDEDIPLDNGLVIPKGIEVTFLLYELHRDHRVFEDPEKFDPLRFLPERCANRNPYAYIPFSIGPRNCLGQRYAMVQMKTCLAHILRNFEVSTTKKREDLKVIYGMVLEPSGSIPLTFKKRTT